jgi:hypothetical protein
MAQTLETAVADQPTAGELKALIEQLGREIYGIGSVEKLTKLVAAGGLADRPGAPYLVALLEIAA